jgi:hypothetical protein
MDHGRDGIEAERGKVGVLRGDGQPGALVLRPCVKPALEALPMRGPWRLDIGNAPGRARADR